VRWQATFLNYVWAMDIANWVYAWGHYPVMLAIALWLVIRDPVKFRFVRNVLLVSATIGVISYWLIPAAPPRLMESLWYDFGFIDTVHGAASNVNYFQPGPFVNDYAALPSFHFGWILLSTMAIWANTSNRAVRAGAVALSVIMWWAVTVTGNHYFFDMIFGGVVVVLSWMFVRAMGDVHPARTSQPQLEAVAARTLVRRHMSPRTRGRDLEGFQASERHPAMPSGLPSCMCPARSGNLKSDGPPLEVCDTT
jgi:hypothetical protein